MALLQDTLNFFNSFGHSAYDDTAMRDLANPMREKLLETYTPGLNLGVSADKTFQAQLNTYFEAQTKSLDDAIRQHGASLTDPEKEGLRAALKAQQDETQKRAAAMDNYTGKVPAITQASDLQAVAQEERKAILAAITPLNIEDILHPVTLEAGTPTDAIVPHDATQAALKAALQRSDQQAKKALEDNLNDAVKAMHDLAQQKRDLIGWLAAAQRAKKLYAQGSIFGNTKKDYSVRMTVDDVKDVEKLAKAIASKDAHTLQTRDLRTPSGTGITVGRDANGLSFDVNFPSSTARPGYYTNARHNTKADLLFQAALVKGTGATSIVTAINHSDQKLERQLAREAFEAARENGFPEDKITIKIKGVVQKKEDLIKMRLTNHNDPRETDVRENPVEYTVDKADALIGTKQGVPAKDQQAAIKEALKQFRQAPTPAPADAAANQDNSNNGASDEEQTHLSHDI